MDVNRKKLQEALERVRPGLSNNEVIEQSTTFAFMNGRVVTYNDEVSVSHPVEGLDELSGAVEASKLYPFLNKLTGDEVRMSMNEKFELVVASGKARAGFLLQQEIKLPLNEEVAQKGKWKLLPENFVKAISFVITACGSSMNRPVLTCIHVNRAGYVEGSDGYRIARYELSGEMPVDTFLIPAASASDLIKISPNRIAEGKGWVHFRTVDKTEFACRIFEDKYPNTVPFLKVEGKALTLPKDINDMLNRASIFAKRETILEESVKISLEKGILRMNSDDETGWFEEETEMDYKEGKMHFSIAPYLLRSILNETQGCTLGEQRIKFEGEGWKYVSLLREK